MQLAWLNQTFKEYGYRLTVPRQAILAALSKASKHFSAEELYHAVHKKYPAIGMATVYRTLDLLCQIGLILKFEFGDGLSRYELAVGPDERHHHHLVCTTCSRVIDFSELVEEETRVTKELEKVLAKKYTFKIDTHQIHFLGLCEKCLSGLKESKPSTAVGGL
jgi:Fur family ferric uptake transcriptional regulator